MGLQCVCPYMCVHVCVLRKVEGVKVGGIVQKKKKDEEGFCHSKFNPGHDHRRPTVTFSSL